MNHGAMFYRLGSGLPLARTENTAIGQDNFSIVARELRRAKPLYAKSPFGQYQRQSAQCILKKPRVNNSKHGPLHRDFFPVIWYKVEVNLRLNQQDDDISCSQCIFITIQLMFFPIMKSYE